LYLLNPITTLKLLKVKEFKGVKINLNQVENSLAGLLTGTLSATKVEVA